MSEAMRRFPPSRFRRRGRAGSASPPPHLPAASAIPSTRKQRTPARLSRAMSAGPPMPLSATKVASAGARAASSPVRAMSTVKLAQVAVVDPDQAGLEGARRASSSASSCTSTSTSMPWLDGGGLDLEHLPVVQRGDDDEDCVGAQRARLRHLPGIDHEILAQRRQATRPRAPPRDIRPRPGTLRACPSTPRGAGRAAPRIGAGMSRRI